MDMAKERFFITIPLDDPSAESSMDIQSLKEEIGVLKGYILELMSQVKGQ